MRSIYRKLNALAKKKNSGKIKDGDWFQRKVTSCRLTEKHCVRDCKALLPSEETGNDDDICNTILKEIYEQFNHPLIHLQEGSP